jgi:3-hydroxyacyl-CoA dehydrogenase
MPYQIRRAAVIGSGTMGGGIAALLASLGIPVDLLDITPRDLTPDERAGGLALESPAVRNRIVQMGWAAVLKSRPAALTTPDQAGLVRLGNLEDHFDRLGEADLIIEAVVENLAVKQELIQRLEVIRKPGAIVATNTSGLPIHDMCEGRGKEFQQHFLGMHFFNPPRYLKLLEVIPHAGTLPEVTRAMAEFGQDALGKGVVVCKDTPNFIGNRFASAAGAYEIAYALDHGFSVEEVDALCGDLIGRPRTAVFRLLDLIGLDVMAHVNTNLYEAIPEDESRDLLHHPATIRLIEGMMSKGWLGNKSGQGFYKRVGGEFHVLDLNTLEYKPPAKVRFDSVGANRKIEPLGARIKAMTEATDRAGDTIRHVVYHRLTYAARRIPEIADDIVAIDQAIRWGFAHKLGPFEEWDALGVADSIPKMEAAGFPVAEWVKEMVDGGIDTFYQYEDAIAVGYYDLTKRRYQPLQVKPKTVNVIALKTHGSEVDTSPDASIVDLGDGVALFEIHTKANTLTPAVVEMAYQAIQRLTSDFDGLVIGNQGDLFCGGANLDLQAIQARAAGKKITPAQAVEELGNAMQQVMLGFRAAPKPVVAAAFDRALGGGAELVMAADRVVAHMELYIGQVEIGVGLLPAAGGCKELLRRVVNPVMHIPNADPLPALAKVFELVALAKVSTSAAEARQMGFLAPTDRIVAHRDHLIFEAKREARTLNDSGYRPPQPEKIYAAGRDALAALRTQIYLLQDGKYASEHDALIANKIAWVLCGGDLSEPTWVDEQYILDLERQAFVELIQEPKTIERILSMLTTGKPLRN